MIDKLETKHLVLRKARLDDLESIYNNVWSKKELCKYMLWKVTDSLDEAKIRLDKTIEFQKNHYAYFITEKDKNIPIGFAGVIEAEPNVYEECGICISNQYQNKGYGKEVVNCLKKLVFETLKGDKFIYSCFSINEVSKYLCLSTGFRYFTSMTKIRDYDNFEYISDSYYMDKEMFYKEN